jgi:hypothetical protein
MGKPITREAYMQLFHGTDGDWGAELEDTLPAELQESERD